MPPNPLRRKSTRLLGDFVVEQPRLGCRAAALGQRQHANHAHSAVQRQRQHVADAQAGVRLVGRLPVDADDPRPPGRRSRCAPA